jgi:hypothetical protein
MITHTEERIIKLAKRGLSVKSIARKIGRPDDHQRVLEALKRARIPLPKEETE